MEPDILGDLIAEFEHAVQHLPGEVLRALEPNMRQMLVEHQLNPRALFGPPTDETDRMIARAIQRNFFLHEAFNEFCCRFEPQIRSWLMRRGVDYHRAFDLAQILLMRCFQHRLHSYRPELGRCLGGYLYAAVCNLRREMQRGRASRNIFPLPDELPQQHAASPEEELAGREMEQRLVAEIENLDPELRDVFRLFCLENRSHAEIAAQLKITTKASEGCLFRARRALEERLGLHLPAARRGRPRHDPLPLPPDPGATTFSYGDKS